MNYRIIVGTVLLFVSLAVVAEQRPITQWKWNQGVSMFDLVQRGYRIIAMINEPIGANSGNVFLLQNGKDIYKCSEYHVTGPTDGPRELIGCYELTAPYQMP